MLLLSADFAKQIFIAPRTVTMRGLRPWIVTNDEWFTIERYSNKLTDENKIVNIALYITWSVCAHKEIEEYIIVFSIYIIIVCVYAEDGERGEKSED